MKINVGAIIGVIFEVLAVSYVVANCFLLALKRLLTPLPTKSLKNEVILVNHNLQVYRKLDTKWKKFNFSGYWWIQWDWSGDFAQNCIVGNRSYTD